MDDERLIDIESKLAHQEVLVEQLNDVVTAQERRITALEETCRVLAERLKSVSDSSPSATRPEDELPPHY